MGRSWLRTIPLRVKVPLLVAALMVGVGTLASWLVLDALIRTQRAQVRELAAVALDGLAASIAPAVARRDVWETFDALDHLAARGEGLRVRTALVLLPEGMVLAASDPVRFPTLRPPPADWLVEPPLEPLRFDDARGLARAVRRLGGEDEPTAFLIAEVDTRGYLAERRRALLLLVVSNALLTLLLALGGYALVRRMLVPLDHLARAVESVRRGEEPDLQPARVGRAPEFLTLFRRFADMARAVRERELLLRRLAEEERLALLGRLARGMAHEINNPLAGMLTVVDTLRRHGDRPEVREQALAILERGLLGIRNLVRAALVDYRETVDDVPLEREALDDLQALIGHEVGKKRLRLVWANRLPPGPLPLPAGPVRQTVLNLLLNACRASPVEGRVELMARTEPGELHITIADEGPGLPPEGRALLHTPGEMPPGGTRGLGLWTAGRLWARLGGAIEIETPPEGGTAIHLRVALGRERCGDHGLLTTAHSAD